MAVSRIWAVKERLDNAIDYAMNPKKTAREQGGKYTPEQYGALADVINYVENEEKTALPKYTDEQYQAMADVLKSAAGEEKTEREFFVDGINCNPSTAREQFVTVKEQFAKPDGIQAYHGYLSFKEMDISPEIAQKIGMEFAEKVWGKRFQVVVTTHLNTKHLHCHFVINSVSFVDGKRCRDTSWFKFRHIADELCQKYGLHYITEPNRSKQNPYYYKKEKQGQPTRYRQAKDAVDEALSYSTSVVELKYYLDKMGYKCQMSLHRKYWTVIPDGWDKPIRLKNFGDGYSNEDIIKRLQENQGKAVLLKPFHQQAAHRQSKSNKGRNNANAKRKNLSSLYRLYLYYCYKLGTLPKSKYRHNKQKYNRVHYLLRDDLIKLDEITAQTRLLGKHNINTSEQLFSYKAAVEEKMQDLVVDRKHLRNKIRRKYITDEELSATRKQIFEISSKLKELRKEVKLCDGIAERSGIVKEKLESVIAEEEQVKQREVDRNDNRR